LIRLPVEDFLATLADAAPAPGGGSAAALAGALGASLAAMVARLTVGRARFAAVEEQMTTWRDQADGLRVRLAGLVDADAGAYSQVMAAYRLPEDTPEQQAQRSEAVQSALRQAAELPLSVAAACVDVLELLPDVARLGNRNAATDAAVAAVLAHAGLQGALRNVLVNLASVKDRAFVDEAQARATALAGAGDAALAAAMAAAGPGA
jgi:formiminotetrahydrofolate cyclodeaminase